MDRISFLLWIENQSAPVCGLSQYSMAYLNEGVDNSNVRTGVEHFVEVGLPVDKFQLVELLIVLQEKIHVTLRCAVRTGKPLGHILLLTPYTIRRGYQLRPTIPPGDAPFWLAARKIAFLQLSWTDALKQDKTQLILSAR